MKKSYADIVRGNKISTEDERARLASYSSNDSGYEGLEDLEPLDLEDLKRPEQWYAVYILLLVIHLQIKIGFYLIVDHIFRYSKARAYTN